MDVRGRNRRLLVALASVALLSACVPFSPAPSQQKSMPRFPGFPAIAPYTGTETHSVLLIGDSEMRYVGPQIRAALTRHGLAGEVRTVGVASSSPAGGGVSKFDWIGKLPDMLDRYNPDIVVAEFYGIFNPPTVTANAAKVLIQEIRDHGATPIWVIPPTMTKLINEASARYRQLDATLTDWGTYITPTGVWSHYLMFAKGPRTVWKDLLHTNVLGSYIAAEATVATMRPLWVDTPPVITPAEEPTTTTTTAPTTTTTTTTAPTTTTTTTTTTSTTTTTVPIDLGLPGGP
jgi:hypothetical protein